MFAATAQARVEEVTIPFAPRWYQSEVLSALERFNVLVMHRRWGKTVMGVIELVMQVLECKLPRPQGAYIAPFYSQAKRVAWDYFKQFCAPIYGIKFNESELKVIFPNNGIIYLAGADNPHTLRGMYFDYVVLDEIAQMSPLTWNEVIRPALADRKGGAIFIGTPQGKANKLYEFYEEAKNLDGWYRSLWTVDDSGAIDPEELEAARREMSEDEFQQEFYCSWEAAVKGAYYGHELAEARRDGRIRSVPYEPQYPVYTAWDLGLADATAIWFAQVVRRELRIIDYEEYNMVPMLDVIDAVKEKKYSYARHFAPHDIKVKEYTHGRSRLSIARDAGIDFTVTKQLPIIDGIESGKVMLRRVYIDEGECREGLMALEQYRMDYDEKRQAFRKHPRHDWTSHAADAWRYLALNFDHMIRPTIANKKPKVLRSMTH